MTTALNVPMMLLSNAQFDNLESSKIGLKFLRKTKKNKKPLVK